MFRYSNLLLAGVLLTALGAQELSSDPKQRMRAARDLVKQGAGGIPSLTPMLSDPDQSVRLEAVKSLTEIATPHSIDPLLAATRDNDPEIQERAVDGLVNFYHSGYLPSGISRWGSAVKSRFQKENTQIIDPYVQVRDDVIRAIGRLVRGGANMESRANAARAAGILRGKATLPDLVQALQSKDDQLIFESLIALQKIRDESAGAKVVFLLRDLQPRVQVAAIETVGLLRTRDAIPELQRTFDNARNDRVRRAAIGSLAMMPDASNRLYFERAATDKDDKVKAASAEGLGRLKQRSDENALSAAFAEEPRAPVRLAQAFALVSLGKTTTDDSAPLTYLVRSLNSRAYREVAEAYLNELARDSSVRHAFKDYLAEGTNQEKIRLARALSVGGDAGSISQLESLTKDPDTEVAQESTRALRNLKARLP